MQQVFFRTALFFSAIFLCDFALGQEVIKLISGEEKLVEIINKNGSKIEYRDFYNSSSPSVMLNKNEVLYIQHPDGKKEYLESATTSQITVPSSKGTTNIAQNNVPNEAATTSHTASVNTSELSNNIDKLNTQLKESNKNEDQLLKQILEELNNINSNITLLKATIEKKSFSTPSYTSETSNNKYSAPANNNANTYTPEPTRTQTNTSNSSSLLEPELENIPYQLKNNELIFLERVEGTPDSKMKGLYGGNETNIKAFGTRASVRFAPSSVPKIYIKFDAKGDPSEKLWLLKGTVVKDGRRFMCASTSMTGAARDASSSRIDIQFKKLGDTFYEIIIPNLQPGEYTFTAPVAGTSVLGALTGGGGRASKISCFGID